jgi:DMSO/TMAO reductase YedYZ molybdopterin-dependent catalytic subunit
MSRRGISRRGFLASAATAAGAAGGIAAWYGYFGSSPSATSPPAAPLRYRSKVIPGEPLGLLQTGKLLDTQFNDPFAGGQMLGYLPFLFEGSREIKPGLQLGSGHDARRVINLASLLTPEGRITPADEFYIRTEYPNKLQAPLDWKIKVHGDVKTPEDVSLTSLRRHVTSQGPVLLECSGNARVLQFGLLSVADWAGIPVEKIIERAGPTRKAKSILINGFDEDTHPSHGNHSKPTCSWIFTIEQLVNARAFLAIEMNNRPIPKQLGAPVRLVVPGWYGCVEAKWVNEIRFVDNDRPATLQMLEFASRTLQEMRPLKNGDEEVGPDWARDYRPATIDQVAVPVRVEQWKSDDKLAYRIVGLTWGGPERTKEIQIGFRHHGKSRFEPIDFCATQTSNAAYGIWTHRWMPTEPGLYWIQLRVGTSEGQSRKMAVQLQSPSGGPTIGYYDRAVVIPEV